VQKLRPPEEQNKKSARDNVHAREGDKQHEHSRLVCQSSNKVSQPKSYDRALSPVAIPGLFCPQSCHRRAGGWPRKSGRLIPKIIPYVSTRIGCYLMSRFRRFEPNRTREIRAARSFLFPLKLRTRKGTRLSNRVHPFAAPYP